jgi:hypothetical protein
MPAGIAMTAFSSAWLSLREPLDAASRAAGIVQQLNQVRTGRPIDVIDLACGTGANCRYLSVALGGEQRWCLVDHDQDLLDAVPALMQEWAARYGADVSGAERKLHIAGPKFQCHVRSIQCDLAADLATLELLPPGVLVTASALLDLVSDSWLKQLAARCAAARATVLFALSYDGRMEFYPPDPEDARVTALVNRHQVTDKGFGPALGPAAADRAGQHFQALGYCVEYQPSDWSIPPADQNLQQALIDGWLTAAIEIAPAQSAALGDWHQRRGEHIRAGRSELRVGHLDLLGWISD